VTGDAWWAGVPIAETDVECGGARHTLLWVGGRLVMLEHDEPDDERPRLAFGASWSTCQDLCAAWRRHADDIRVLTLGPRSPDDQIRVGAGALDQLGGRVHHGLTGRAGTGHAPPALPGRGRPPGRRRSPPLLPAPAGGPGSADDALWQDHLELLRLFALPRPLLDRLVLEVCAAQTAELERCGGDPAESHPALLAALVSRVRAVVRAWRTPGGERPEIALEPELHLDPSNPGASLVLAGGDDAALRADVGTGWLAGVWARQLALVDGYLVTELLAVEDDWASARALRPPSGPRISTPRTIELARRSGVEGWIVVRR